MIVAVPDVEEVAPRQYQGFHWKILFTNLASVGNMYNSFSPISIFRPIIQSKAFWTWKYTVEDCFMYCGLEWYPIHSLDTFRLLACSCVWGTEGYIWAKLLGLPSYSQLIFYRTLVSMRSELCIRMFVRLLVMLCRLDSCESGTTLTNARDAIWWLNLEPTVKITPATDSMSQ